MGLKTLPLLVNIPISNLVIKEKSMIMQLKIFEPNTPS